MTINKHSQAAAAAAQALPPLTIREQNKLIESHVQLARSRASAFRASSMMPYDDLLGEAYLSLVKAARRFDPTRGVTFGAYAKQVINGYLFNYLRDRARSVRVPRKYTAVYLQIKKAEKHGKSPLSSEVLAEQLGLPLELIEETREAMSSNCCIMNEQTVGAIELDYELESGQDLDYKGMLLALEELSNSEIDLLVDALVNHKSPRVLSRLHRIRETDLEDILSQLLQRIIGE